MLRVPIAADRNKRESVVTYVEEGKLAFQYCKPSESNPYAMYSSAWAQWNQGWSCEQLKGLHRKTSSPKWLTGELDWLEVITSRFTTLTE